MTGRRRDLAHVAADAAAGRRVVCSAGALDGPMLRALAAVGLVPADGEPSTWAEGIATTNTISDMRQAADNVQLSDATPGGK